jgi:HK97 family phage portal protein
LKSLKDRLGREEKAMPLNGTFQIVAGQLVSTPDNKQSYIDNGYNINDIVYSVVNLILDKVRIAPWCLYKVVDESSLKAYIGIVRKKNLTPKDYKKALEYRSKALEPITTANMSVGKLMELLKWPNEYETFPDFIANGCGYKLLTGDKYIWADILGAGANKGLPQNLWLLPSQQTNIKATTTFPVKETGYEITTWNLNYTKEEVLHEKYWNPNWGVNGQQLYGMSPLKAALKTLTRNNYAKDASSAKYQNNGLEAIVYVDDQRLTGEVAQAQATALKAKLISEYTGASNQGKIAASGYKVGVANLGLSPVELGIIESEKWDMRMICNIFGVPSQMMNDPENKTYNNQNEGEKALTTRSALPLLTSMRDNLNRKLQTDWGFKGQNVFVDFDMGVFTELQEDVAEVMKWLQPLLDRGFPLNRALDILNIETIDDPLFDESWITPQMGTPLSEWSANSVDNALNNDGVDSNI